MVLTIPRNYPHALSHILTVRVGVCEDTEDKSLEHAEQGMDLGKSVELAKNYYPVVLKLGLKF